MKTRKLTVDEPCNQSWNEMAERQNGRYCSNCEKTVIDFTGMTGQSILQLLESAEGDVCGRVKPSQLMISVPRPISYSRQPEFSLSALVLGLALTTFCALNTGAQPVPVKGKAPVAQVRQDVKPNRKPPVTYTISVQREDHSAVDSAVVTVTFDDGSFETYFSDSLGVCHIMTEKAISGVEASQSWQWRSRIYQLADFDASNKLVVVVEDYDPPIMGKMILQPVQPQPAPATKPTNGK